MTGRELSPADHTRKEVREVLQRLVCDRGWTLRKGGHWGVLHCSCSPLCTRVLVPGTPRSASTAARRIAQAAARCPKPEDDPSRPPRGGVVV
ncbi:hypothetical protein LO771_12710 [Streptacidiphilus sp. ASG 303]|uniref:hypothetical protein n=1 Tax=Streptacidiphilus sp. ASG 303 TaxID=2896847 RepID=UPI001E4DC2D3|nr:hypothetical protein [Streptacidiphilus sp. ASG 303]MCD0483244.1 hypothetical protein [Streptacidiphilus sp. ASG 303]